MILDCTKVNTLQELGKLFDDTVDGTTLESWNATIPKKLLVNEDVYRVIAGSKHPSDYYDPHPPMFRSVLVITEK